MATVSISITQEAHKKLVNLRKGKESFSEIINRLTGRKSIMEFAGILSKESADKIEGYIQKNRVASNKDAERKVRQIVKELQQK